MITIDDRNAFIKKMNLSNNVNNLIFAKTIFKVADGNVNLLDDVANVILNRFFYEYDIDNEITFIKCITDVSLFECWKDFKSMDLIDLNSDFFQKCFAVAKKALMGKLVDNTFSSIKLRKKSELPSWAIGLKFVKMVDDYLFYNNCA